MSWTPEIGSRYYHDNQRRTLWLKPVGRVPGHPPYEPAQLTMVEVVNKAEWRRWGCVQEVFALEINLAWLKQRRDLDHIALQQPGFIQFFK